MVLRLNTGDHINYRKGDVYLHAGYRIGDSKHVIAFSYDRCLPVDSDEFRLIVAASEDKVLACGQDVPEFICSDAEQVDFGYKVQGKDLQTFISYVGSYARNHPVLLIHFRTPTSSLIAKFFLSIVSRLKCQSDAKMKVVFTLRSGKVGVSHLRNINQYVLFEQNQFSALKDKDIMYVEEGLPEFDDEKSNQCWVKLLEPYYMLYFYKCDLELRSTLSSIASDTPMVMLTSMNALDVFIVPTDVLTDKIQLNVSIVGGDVDDIVRAALHSESVKIKQDYMQQYGITGDLWSPELSRLKMLFGVNTEIEVLTMLPDLM